MRSKTHHEELVTSTSYIEESDAVVEWLGRWNGATNSSEKKVVQRVAVSVLRWTFSLPERVDVLICGFKSRRYDGAGGEMWESQKRPECQWV